MNDQFEIKEQQNLNMKECQKFEERNLTPKIMEKRQK
jgi:hypothetical protein